MSRDFKVVNKNVRKVDGLALASGNPMFVGDMVPGDALYAGILTSPHAHAIIKKIDTSKAEALEGVHAVIHHGNVPRVPHTTAGQGYPEPSPYDTYMFDRKVRFVGDRVAAVAAESPEILKQAMELIEVEYEVLPAVFDAEEALKPGAPVIHDEEDAKVIIPVKYEKERNLVADVRFSIGDVDGALQKSDVVISREFSTPYAQHCPIEPHVAMARIAPDGRIEIVTSTQVPFHVRRIVAQTCQIPVRNIRVIKPRIGGGFGTKQEVLIEDVVTMLAMRTRRPVYLEYTREEEFVSSRTRHPSKSRIDLGVNKDGTITAIRLYVLLNTGAYGSHALTVGSNAGSKVLPMYPVDNIEFHMEAAYTNLPVGGAYRGYGATQAVFALESVIEEAARAIGMEPLEFRKKNHIREGQSSPVFKALGEGKEGVEMEIGSIGLDEAIEIGAREIGWYDRENKKPSAPWKRRGLGVATLMQGSSIPYIDMASATVKLNDDGSVNLIMGATDLGTGSDTVLSQIAAEELGIPVEWVIPYSSDTDLTPFDVGAYASSTTYLSGMAVKKAAALLRMKILQVAAKMMGLDSTEGLRIEDGSITGGPKPLTVRDVALQSLYVEDQEQLIASASHVSHKSPPPFAAHFVDLEVDLETGEIDVLKYVAAVDCGTAIHPKLAEGQTEGALLNGLSYALTEEYIFNEKGRMLNPNFGHYKIFSTRDLPEVKAILVPTYEETGPYGAKSVSEISINGALPAISNAVYDATGVRLNEGPFTPEKVLRALRQAGIRP